MAECIFCHILEGHMAAEVVYESPTVIAFLDKFPAARGHTLVIPRTHVATLPELGDDAIGDLFREVKVVMGRLQAALRPVGFNVGWNHGIAAGQHVFHLHVHILPRYDPGGRGIQTVGPGMGRANLAEIGATSRAAR